MEERVSSFRYRHFINFEDFDVDIGTEALPDLSNMLRPSPIGDFAAYVFFSAGGLFIGGELGLLAGSWSARRAVTSDAERKARIERAVRRYRADVLRREVQKLEAGEKGAKPVDIW
jgi:hypothetical protein